MSEDTIMEVEVEVTQKDFGEYMKRCIMRNKVILIILIIFTFLIGIQTIYTSILGNDSIRLIVITVIITIVPFWLFMYLLFLLQISITKRMPRNNGFILGKRKIILTETDITEVSDVMEFKAKWAGIYSLQSNKKYIYIYLEKNMAHTIPKRYFESEKKCKEFLDFIEEHVKQAGGKVSIR